ncbi:MAG TPA: hypothetical protein VLJ20_01310 [Acetobacteraceae bacterium]|nr:hypothetical protein [Acetobacteraceae bacterium]
MKSFTALSASFVLGSALLAGCAAPPDNRFAAYRTPNVPPECRAAVYDDSGVKELISAGTAVPAYMAEHQNKLAFKEAEAERRCMQKRGLMPAGGVEPVKYPWYPPLF